MRGRTRLSGTVTAGMVISLSSSADHGPCAVDTEPADTERPCPADTCATRRDDVLFHRGGRLSVDGAVPGLRLRARLGRARLEAACPTWACPAWAWPA